MHQTLRLTLTFVTLFVFGVGSVQAGPVNKTLLGGVAIKGYDSVAYFVDEKPIKGSKKFEIEWQGATWRFANTANLEKFRSDPEKYAPRYGGYCAWAVSQGSTANINPAAWTIVNDRLYLNYNEDIQTKWRADVENLIELGDKNWPALRDD